MERKRLDATTDEFPSLAKVRSQAESDCIEDRLIHFQYRMKQTAASLDISRVHLYNLRKKHGLDYSQG